MINIVCALHCEAKPLIDYFGLSSTSDCVYPIFYNQDISLVISGVGKIATASAMAYLFVRNNEQKNQAWLNYGIAGHKSYNIGQWINVNKVIDVVTGQNWYPARFKDLEFLSGMLKTVDHPVDQYEENTLYDMEGSAFMEIATRFADIELMQLFKVVSDNEDNHAKNISKKFVANLLSDNIEPLLDCVNVLRKKQLEFQSIYADDQLYFDCLEKWHFTQYQRKELQRLVQRWVSLGGDNVEEVMSSESSKQVIDWFKTQIDSLVLEF